MRDATVTKLSVQVHQDTGTIVVKNDGKGIPVKKMRVSGTEGELWTPAVIMSRMLSGSNFDVSEPESAAAVSIHKPRYTGGRNGLGAKLTGILSTRFAVDTCDADEHKRFRQTWTNGLRATAGECVTEFSKDKGGTTITYTPDYAWFGMPGLTDDAVALIRTRVLTSAAGNTARPVAVEWVNGTEKITLPAGLGLGLKDLAGLLSRTEQKKMAAESVMQPGSSVSSARATIVAVPRVSECAEALGFVNSVRADRGTHVRWAQARLAEALMKRLKQGKHADLPLTAGMVAKSLTLLVSVLVDSPAFDSQTKDELNTPARAWGFDWVVSDKFVDALVALVGEKLVADAVKKQNKGAAAALGVVSTAGRRAVPVIPKYDPAEDLGKGGCTLGLAEGDSAKALLVSMHLGKKFGIFPLRGKLKNARGLTPAQLAANAELGNLIKIIGLQPGADYSDKVARDRLFYANVMLFVDQDPDGSHIAGLLLNFFAAQWPTLLAAIPNFITRFRTPLLAVVPSGPTFFSRGEFEAWRAADGRASSYKVKYYKGLGTSTAAEGRQYAANKERHVQALTWTGQACEAAVDAAFNEKAAAARRALITAATVVTTGGSALTYAEFVAQDLVQFFVYANRRALPSFVDGLKVAQRKVLHALLHRAGNAEMRVCDAVGYVSGYSHYHHGDAALGETIMHMMQNHVGSNNINLLYPAGQAGTRLADRGTHASTRYVHTCLEPITAALFNKEDLALLPAAIEDGEEAEPLFFVPVVPLLLINGAEGLGAGWSTTVHPREPRAVFAATRAWVTADAAGGDGPAAAACVPLPPHWDGWAGSVTPVPDRPATYTVKGVAARLPDGRVHITELPPGTWTDDFLTYVRGREELSVNHTPDEAKVDIYVKNLMPLQEPDALLANLKLVDVIRDTNMHGFLGDKLGKADAAHDILNMHAMVRLEYYKKRQAAQLAALAADVHTLQNKLEFITSVIDRSFVPFFKTKAQLRAELAERYPADLVPVLSATPTDKYCSDEVTALRASLVEAQQKREVLAAKTPHAMWHADLDHLESVYTEFKAEKLERYCTLVRPKAQKRKL